MAKKIDEKTHQKLFIFLMFFVFNLNKSKGSDFELLLSFKSSLSDPLNSLSNWNSSLPFCNWNGISCLNSSHVTKIHLPGRKISGKLSESIFLFPFLESLDLSNNQLSGGIQTNFSSSFSLKYLNLSNNNFSGPMPKASIHQLNSMDLSNNLLSGEIPEEIGFFSGLKFVDLGGNSFVGKIPKSITNLTSLESLTLASNQIVGEIPPELGLMKSLKFIYLGYNNLSGRIPTEIGELTSLNHLNLVNNNLTGEIPPSIGNLTDLRYLFLYFNKLTGSIPPSIFGLKNLVSLDLSDNFLSGEIPELVGQLEKLEVLHLFSNEFSGKIPSRLSDLPRLQVLQLWSNKLTGEIPKTLGKQNNLSVLDLSTNNLAGEIPASLCDSGQLFKLILFSNSLQGKIPNSLSHCKSLQRLRLQNNRLSGELPPEFTKLPVVYFLDISGNNFSGYWKWDMPELAMLNLARNRFSGALPDSFGSKKLENLDLSENGFSGDIPASFGNFSELMQLNLSKNELSGKIPDELSSCKKLVSLDLSNNQLVGQIPTSFSQMLVLSQLDLSINKLSGKIPENLGEMESLVVVNISHNHFHGNLPSTGAFFDINLTAVTGNRLCGGNKITSLPPCKSVAKVPIWSLFVVVLVAVIVGVSLVTFFIRKNNEKFVIKRVENTEGGNWDLQFFCLDHSKSITMRDILSCVRGENFVSAEFVVREMNVLSTIPSESWKELAEVGKIQNPNVVKFIAICRSEKCGFVVYEYVEGKILSEAIRGLDWERRRKIAIGIAKGIQYLHCRFSGRILVGEVSPEKIIVDGKDEPRLRLSFPRPAIVMDTKCAVSSAYVAPETRESKEITEKSDIYGFGLVLIQLLTGRTPTDAEFGLHESIVEWARYCYSDCHLDTWIDPAIKGHASNNQADEIVKTMNLALRCTAFDPVARPCARDIPKTLESITSSSSCALGLKFSSTI